MRTPADDRLHQDVAVVASSSTVGNAFPSLEAKPSQQDAAFLQKFRHLRIRHLAVADDGIDVQYARRVVTNVVLTAVPLAGLDHIAAAQGGSGR